MEGGLWGDYVYGGLWTVGNRQWVVGDELAVSCFESYPLHMLN